MNPLKSIPANLFAWPRLAALTFMLSGLFLSRGMGQVYEKFFSFTDANAELFNSSGSSLNGLVLGRDGNLYGTTSTTIYRRSPDGVMTTLVVFTGVATGSTPFGRLVQGSDGNFYGTTAFGGANNAGTVFRMSPSGVFTKLVDFTNSGTLGDERRGANPYAGLIQSSDGNFYGTTGAGGTNFLGTMFMMTPAGSVRTVFDFGGGVVGANPESPLVQDSQGNFYGTTRFGGSVGYGTVFKILASPTFTLSTMVNFTRSSNPNDQQRGANPVAGLVLCNDGNLYGATNSGGTAASGYSGGGNGYGTIYKLTLTGAITTLVDFTGAGSQVNRGTIPITELNQGSDGNIYGTTSQGGASNYGTIFRMTLAGALTTLVDFTNTGATNSGSYPYGGLTQGSDGNFFGTTQSGGTATAGTLFTLTPSGTLTTLISFSGTPGAFGIAPNGVIQGLDGNFYGTTALGGLYSYGTIFKFTPTGILTKLGDFTGNGTVNRGSAPTAPLILGADGNFYGTTLTGGSYSNGTIFKMTPSGVVTTLIDFTGNGTTDATRGSQPRAKLIQASDGNFYGTTNLGGANGLGTIYKVTLAGSITTLFDFNSTSGGNSFAGLVQGTDGKLYGTASTGGAQGFGTVFRITTGGAFAVMVNFTNSTGEARGSAPYGGLIQGSDSLFYGTTVTGGQFANGTAFTMSMSGVMATLIDFGGGGPINSGANPEVDLVQASDGKFYGTTRFSGPNDYGTLFSLTPARVLSTIYDYTFDPLESHPNAPLVQGTDGNLYGATQGGDGAVYRIILKGAPSVYFNPPVVGLSSASLTLLANARGSITGVTLQYGTSGTTFPNSLPLTVNLNGYATTPLGTTLSSLTPNTTYYYRVVATNADGTTTTTVQSFSTFAKPTASVSAASNVLPASATLNGIVNAQNYSTAVTFEYADNAAFLNSFTVTAVPGTVIGNTDTGISKPVAGLASGQTYYYRISATNAGGTTVSGVSTFTTLVAPVEMALPASFVTSQSAQLNGTVNAVGASAAVTFEYGTDNVNFPFSVAGTPSPVTGSAVTAVSATISNSAGTPLVQGTTYYFRVKGSSLGGTSVSSSLPFSLNVLSGFARQFPNAPLSAQGFVLVNLSPSGLNSGWRFAGEQLWRPGGVPAFGLTSGDYTIEYEPVPGYIQPAPDLISVTSGAATILNKDYYPTTGGDVGGLNVILQPTTLANSSVPVAQRAQWRFYGEDDTKWRDSSTTVNSLIPGKYLIECKPVAGQTTPAIASVTVSSGATALPTLTYFVSGNPTGAQPALLPFSTVTNSATPAQPYAFVGQIRSDVGSSTGFVVKSRVVATAGHVVFDDGALAYLTSVQWIFQRYAGTYEPVPQVPTGFYVFDGYATRRIAENTPGASTTASQNLDVAALYFTTGSAGYAGYSGFLGSDANTNEFLTSAKAKVLVGYPVDGITLADRGKVFATAPVTAAFTQVNGTDTSGDAATNGKPYRVYTSTALSSVGGNSGGPLCVQYDDGNYYPAAIYLGGAAITVVRSIDSAVIDLFNRAEVSGNNGPNNTGGGITQVNTSVSGTTQGYAVIQVTLQPTAAVTAGAKWRLGPNATRLDSGYPLNNQPVGSKYQLYLDTVPGFLVPPLLQSSTLTPKPNFQFSVVSGQLSAITYTYEGITSQPQNVSASAGGSATFTVTASQDAAVNPATYQWRQNGTNISGANFASYTKSNLASGDAGTYDVIVTWGTDGFQTSTPAALTLGGSSQQTFAQWQSTYSQMGGANATPQHDGVANLLKFLYDINPTRAMTTADKAALPVVALTTVSGTSYLTLNYRQNANMSGVTVNVQTSTDLSTWSPVTSPNLLSQQIGTDGTTGDPMMQVGVKATGSVRYIRLNVTSP